MKAILVVGGTGAQGSAVIRALSKNGYNVLLFTRDINSSHVQELLALKNVEAVSNHASSGYDLKSFEEAARRSYGVFLNTDGFALGEQAEVYWGIQLYETALKARVRHIIYSGLDNNYRDSGYNSDFYVGHYQGKAKVQDFIKAQPRSDTAWTIIRTGPYIELLSEVLKPHIENGRHIFTYPLGSGAIPFVHLDDFSRYVLWALDNPLRSNRLDLGVATAHVDGQAIAEAFKSTTGQDALYQDISASDWVSIAFNHLPDGKDTKIGYRSTKDQSNLSLTYGQNFVNWWNLYKASAGNTGLIRRDYELLDEILPDRVKSVKAWMESTGYTGERRKVLKGAD